MSLRSVLSPAPVVWLLPLMLVPAPGCLLLADPPELTDDGCHDADLDSRTGTAIIASHTDNSRGDAYRCFELVANLPDAVFEWTAPRDGNFEFTLDVDVDGDGESMLRYGVTSPTCDGVLLDCEEAPRSVSYAASAGETVHVVIEQGPLSQGAAFMLSITETSSSGESEPPDPPDPPDPVGECVYHHDGKCDEPEGTGLCPEGSDAYDCQCIYRNDGECDEPEGTGLCPEGSDTTDCI